MHKLPYWRLSGFYFFYFAFIGAFSPYWSLYLKSLSFSASQIGVLMSASYITRIFSPNIWGWLADHFGRRVMIVQLAAVAGLLSYIAVFFGTGFYWLMMVMMLISFFWSASLPLVEATTLSHLGDNTGQYGRVRLWGSIGFICTVVAVGYVLDVVVIEWLLWIVLALEICIVLFSRTVPEAVMLPHVSDQTSILRIVRRPEILVLFASCFLMVVAHGPYNIFYSIYLVDHGYSKSIVGWFWAIGVLVEIGIFFWSVKLFRWFSLRHLLLASFLISVLRFLIIGWGVDNLALLLFAQTLHAATFGTWHAASVAVIHRYFGGRNQAKGQALYTSVFGAGGAVGGLASGYAWESVGPGWTFTFASICAACGFILLWWKLNLDETITQ